MKHFLISLLFFTSSVFAGSITLINSGEEVSGNVKYCFYESSIYSEVIPVDLNRKCPHTKTFDTGEEE